MAAKQTRLTISVALELFERLKAFADEHEISMAQVATQGIEAMLDGRVPLAPAADPHDLANRTLVARGRMSEMYASRLAERRSEPPRIASPDWAAASRERNLAAAEHAAIAAGLTPTVAFPVTTVIYEDVMDAAVRACTEMDAVFTAAIDRMLDHLETPTTVWCRGCTQTIGDCRCARPRTSAQAVPR